MDDVETLKKDLKGRNKKIQKLLQENAVIKAQTNYYYDKFVHSNALSLRLYRKYIDVVRKLAEYEAKENNN